MVVKNEYLNFYLKCEKYFAKNLSYGPLRPAPDLVVRRKKGIFEEKLQKFKQKSLWLLENKITTLYISTAENKLALTKAIITRECLLSFFSKEIRTNPVIYAFVYRRLLYGKKPLNNPQKKALDKFFNSAVSSLEQECSLDNFTSATYHALEIYIRKDKIGASFKKYAFSLANFKEFTTENDFNLPDAILTDVWLKLFFVVPFKIDEFYLFFEMIKIFRKLGEPYSLLFLKEHIKSISIKDLRDKDFSRLLIEWQKDLSKIEKPYLSLSNRSAAFFYRLNWNALGLGIFYFVVRFNERKKRDTINFAFKHLTGLLLSEERLFEGSVIKYGLIRCRIQESGILNEFFESLKLNYVIDEYIFFKRAHFSSNFNIRNKKNSKKSLYEGIFVDYKKNNNILKPDLIDFIILENLIDNFVGLKVDLERSDFFIEKIKNELRTIEAQIKNQTVILKKMTEIRVNIKDIKLLIPLSFRRKEIIEEVQLKYLVEIISKKFGDLGVKFIFDNFYIIFSTFHEFYIDQNQKLANFDSIKDFLNNSPFKKKDPESYIFLKQSFSSLEQYFVETSTLENFGNWIFNTLSFFEKNLEKFKEIMNIFQIISEYLKIINFPDREKNISLNFETLTNYFEQTYNELHIDIEKRIQKMKEFHLIIPDMIGSIAPPDLFTRKILFLKNIEMEDKRIQLISKQFPHIQIMFSENSKYVFIEIMAHPDLNKLIYDTIHRLLKKI